MLDDAGGRFTINDTTGVVTVLDATKLDYETDTSHSITVRASGGSDHTDQTFTINVTDVAPSTPTDSNAGANTVSEGASNGATVGITAHSTDPNGPAITYSLFDDAGGRFTINATTGVVTVLDATKLDYETDTSHSITVRASDGSDHTDQTFTINVTDVAPSTPTDSNAGANTVSEGASNGATVGITAHSTDPNGPAITYSLFDDAGGRFTINATTGVVTVLDATKLDYETDTSHSITVR